MALLLQVGKTTHGTCGQLASVKSCIMRFGSGPLGAARLNQGPRPKWRNGRRRGFKIPRLHGRAGSSPALGTSLMIYPEKLT